MFTAYADDQLFYSSECPDEMYKLIKPKLTKERNKPDIFEFTVAPNNIAYGDLECLVSWIEVYRDDELWFEGYMMTEKTNFWNQKTITCEGSLALLARTMQPNGWKLCGTIRQYLDYLLEVHNSKMKHERDKFYIGSVTVNDDSIGDNVLVTEYDSTYNYLNAVVERYGGYIHISYDTEGRRLLNYYDDSFRTSSQQIVFGNNLMDHTKNYDRTSLATVLIPLGMTKTEAQKKIDEENKREIEDEEGKKTTIEKLAIEVAQQKYGFTQEEVRHELYVNSSYKNKFKDSDDILEKEKKYNEKTEEYNQKQAELNAKIADPKTTASQRESYQKQLQTLQKNIASLDENKQKLAEEKAKRMEFDVLWDLRMEHVLQVAKECNIGKWGKDEPTVKANLEKYGYNYAEISALRETKEAQPDSDDEEHGIILTDVEEEIEGNMRISIAPVNEGSPYLVSEAEKTYGWIEKVVIFEDVYDTTVLKYKGEQYLKDMQFDNMVLEVSAFDLSYMNKKEAN